MVREPALESQRTDSVTKDQRAFEELLRKLGGYMPGDKIAWVEGAYHYAAEKHNGQLRRSGDNYIQHPLHTALLAADLKLDSDAIAAALLHDVPEDCGVPMEEIEKRFGPEVRLLVDGVTKLSRIARPKNGTGSPRQQLQAENLRKMLLAMAEDIRVVLIKLADRLHNMRTLSYLPPQKRRDIAMETMDIYAPLAHRLGIWEFKWELEDLSFRHLYPDKYKEIAGLVARQRRTREEYIRRVTEILRGELDKAGVKVDIQGRPKHLYSIYRKMEKYQAMGRDFSQIYDLLALRMLVDTVQDCYGALGVVHSLWHPIPGQFDDYIANPKPNGYQALHTTVMGLDGHPLEVQIKTFEMHRIAEFGVAAHWRYKEGATGDVRFEEKLTWLRQLLEWQRELGQAEEFVDAVKGDIFKDQVFVFTPKGDIKELPAGSTPIDFAYRIHTDLGNRCIGAKVNGRLVSLNTALKTGDTVDVLVGSPGRGPSRDWLNPELGYVHTSNAREKVRQWFKRQERSENIQRGKEIIEKELKRLGISAGEEELARLFRYKNVEDFLAALGYGDISPGGIAQKLAAQEERPVPIVHPSTQAPASPSVTVLGVGDLLTSIARCCHPVPGDPIVGYITRTRGIAVHQESCPNITRSAEPERIIKVDWGTAARMYAVPVRIRAMDRVGLWRDIALVVSAEGVNITESHQTTEPGGVAAFLLNLEVKGLAHLHRLLARLDGVAGIVSASRLTD